MEPQLPTPNHTPEQGPAQFSGEALRAPTPEVANIPRKPEQQESHEAQRDGPKGDPAQAQPITPPPLPTLDPVKPSQLSGMGNAVTEANPLVAADDDLIEKEWVEKAKKVIAETKQDPYLQENAVSKLQADYLQKRYGKSVKLPNDG